MSEHNEVPEPIKQTVFVAPGTVFFEPLTEDDKKLEPLHLLPVGIPVYDELRARYKNMEFRKTKHGDDWAKVVEQTGFHAFYGGLHDLGERKDSEWTRHVSENGIPIGPYVPEFKEKIEPNQRLTGANAVTRVRSLLGLGSTIRFPLYHTGIWFEFRCPTDAELYRCMQAISQEKSDLGAQTFGRVFTAANVYHAKHVMSLAMDILIDCNVENWENLDGGLLNLVSMKDIQTICWAIGYLVHPNGYPMAQPCVTNPEVCQNIDNSVLHVGRIHWVDRSRLTTAALKLLSRNRERVKVEEVIEVRDSLDRVRTIEITPEVFATLKTPTIAKYIDSGYRWFSEIIQQIDTAFRDIDAKNRRQFLLSEAAMSVLRHHAHWFDQFTVQGGVMDDPTDISETLSALSESPDEVERIVDEITAMIKDGLITMIAIPKTNCTKCGKPHMPISPEHPNLITFDAMKTFFTLAVRKYTQGTRKSKV